MRGTKSTAKKDPYQKIFMTVSETVTLKSNSFFEGPEDCLDSVTTFFSTFLFELRFPPNFKLILIKTSSSSSFQMFICITFTHVNVKNLQSPDNLN